MSQETSLLKNKILLITGGTGSFGTTLCRKFVDSELREIRIFSRDEKKQDEMRHEIRSPKVKFFIGDVRDPQSVDLAMPGVDYVFHAAALKQVPSCEFYPMEAVKTNIIGTENVVNSAIKHCVKKLVCLSTDKAVYPINAMGISKAMMEKIVLSKARIQSLSSKTELCVTRYGNVMASRGSVIPLFINQLQSNNPATITDPDMTRFMMSLDEAVDLVMFAFANGKSGDLFVQKSPGATIKQLASVLKKILGSQLPVKVIGTRHGEKKHEVLLSTEECLRSEDLGQYFKVSLDGRDLNYGLYFNEGQTELSGLGSYSSENTRRLTDEELEEKLLLLPCVQKCLKEKELVL